MSAIDDNVGRMIVDDANTERRAVECLRRKARRALDQCRYGDYEALAMGVFALSRDLRKSQEMVARICAPWFEVRA